MVEAQSIVNSKFLVSILLHFCFLNNLIIGVQSASADVALYNGTTCSTGTVCTPFTECQAALKDSDFNKLIEQICLVNDRFGLCCPIQEECVEEHPGSKSVIKLPKEESTKLRAPYISSKDLKSVLHEVQLQDAETVAFINKISAEHTERKKRSTRDVDSKGESREEVYQRNLGIAPNISDLGSANDARLIQQLTLTLSKKLGLTTPKQVALLKSIPIIEPDKCSVNITCSQYLKYRPIDGSCNNLANPDYGKVLTPYSRALYPKYGDSVDSPKLTGPRGDLLPLARHLSTTLIKDKPMEHHDLDTLALAFGQFLDHDITQVVGSTLPDGSAITCCNSSSNEVLSKESLHPSCFPIEIPDDDPFYSRYSVKCLNFARTAFGIPENCVLGPRTQINNLTPWVDGSIIYGATKAASKELRAGSGGQLAIQTTSSGTILPTKGDMCNNNTQCLAGGDSRVNQQPGLMATHITWLREHNRIAKELAKLNPLWSDEELFQEARRIVIAEFQHVTYNEFLPLIIGSDLMKKYDLYPHLSGFNEYYDPELSPAIIQEFATAAFRLHTLIPGWIELRDNNLNVTRNTSLTTQYYNPSVFYEKPTVYQSVINGLLSQPTCPADNIITDAITNHLFEPGTHGSAGPWGYDLFSIDIQRGRDHGLAGYNDWREACGFKRANNFSDLSGSFYAESLPLIESLYSTVDDIDLVVGLNLEYRPKGQNVGPTAACIITETFRKLKFSDRFWYENSGQPSSFDLNQLNSIRNVSYARIHCDNNGIEFSQEMAFIQPSDLNPRVPCSQLNSKSVNLKLWKNEPLGTFGVALL